MVPFLGVAETSFLLCIINRSLPNGNITDFTRQNENANRLELVSGSPYSPYANQLKLLCSSHKLPAVSNICIR